MKISYRTHPALRLLKERKLDIDAVSKLSRYNEFEKNIKALTKPFIDAIRQCYSRLQDHRLREDLGPDAGVILEGKEAMFYVIADKDNFFILYYIGQIQLARILCMDGTVKSYIKEEIRAKYRQPGQPENTISSFFVAELFTKLAFIKYADIQTKELPPKSKKTDIDCKYVNDTDNSIKILDSLWFTNLVKSDKFNVRGHLRLQSKKKNGEWTKEFIWISEYQKQGYLREADKIKEGFNETMSDIIGV